MSVNDTLAERGARYGKFVDHAKIAQGIQDVMREAPSWRSLDADIKQALTVIADKIARILNGDSKYIDNYHDIQGYAKLVETRLQEEENAAKTEKVVKLKLADTIDYDLLKRSVTSPNWDILMNSKNTC